MAIITLQEPFKSFRGRDEVINGQVLFPSLRRNVSRTWVNPANPSTTFQDVIRALFTALTQAYSNVSDSDNAGWVVLAPFLNHPDKDGNQVKVSPKAAYITVNFWRNVLGGATSDVAPTYAAVPGILSISTVKRNGADTGWQFTYTWDGANTQLALKATAPLPGVRRQPRLNDYRFATDSPVDSIFNITSAGGTITVLDTISRYDYATADRIGIWLQIINDDGIALQSFFFPAIVAAP